MITKRQADAAALLLKRREALDDLNKWARINGFEPALHHKLINEKLQAVERGEIRKLMLFCPPGSAKSTYTSKLFPPWFLARRPSRSILSCSYSHILAEQFGRWGRNCVKQNANVLGYTLRQDSQAAGEWETTNGGKYLAAGVGSGIAGQRSDLGLIDDPIGSQEDADSKTVRDKQWDWYNNDFVPRLKPGGSIVLIMNRRNEDDLAGRLLEREGAEWAVVCLPMLAEDNDLLGRAEGERLWPEWFTSTMVEEARKNAQTFSALYQQHPTPEQGEYFKADWLIPYTPRDLPKNLRFYTASDHAVATAQVNDRTCLLSGGVDSEGVLWILPDIWWKRGSSDEVVAAMLDLCRRRRPIVWWAEKGHITQSIGPFLRKRMIETNVYANIEEVTPKRDKPTRAQSIAGRMAQGQVRFPVFASWWADARHELLSFPHGKHDDFVDALAHLGNGLARMVGSERPTPETPDDTNENVLTFGWLKKQEARRKLQTEMAKYADR